jgi:hypothetical protein
LQVKKSFVLYSMNCKNCGCSIPTKRIELGYKECIDCSTVDTYGTIDIVYHKTGNTVQHVDKETAKHINKISRRPGFGSNLGRIGKGGAKEFSSKINIGASTVFIGSEAMFEKVGEEAMYKLDLLGLDKALAYLDKCLENITINYQQYNKIKQAITAYENINPR